MELSEKITASLAGTDQRNALLSAVKRGRDARAAAIDELPNGATFRGKVKSIKERCIDSLDELVERFTRNAEMRGARVYFAKTGMDACDYVLGLAQEKNAKLITKSKSLTSEEIELNHPLEEAGLRVLETDLGERIIQMAGELPYHLVFPAVHKTTSQVAELLSRATGEVVNDELGDIMRLMRRTLRAEFLNADIGITGANVAIAETGTFLIETNEGNGRLVSSIPPVHVCIMGAEKIVETIDDALKMILAHPVSATGQLLTTYVSLFGGRSPLGGETTREIHIVILDNGRFEMRQDNWMREALHCIRCGACMNICPTYGVLGGHVFGHIYPGPIGIPWTAEVHGLDKAAEFSDLCISCGLCKEICPAEIDMPMMIAKVKHRALGKKSQPIPNRVLMASETIAKISCAMAPLSNWLLQTNLGKFLREKLLGLEKRRPVPRFSRETFERRWKKLDLPKNSAGRKVALFVDYFANYVHPELAVSAARLLAESAITLSVPKQRSSGYPYISYGELDKAKRVAIFNVEHFAPFARNGHDVVGFEPTAVYALKYAYPKLLDYSDESQQVAAKTFEIFEYLEKLRDVGHLRLPRRRQDHLRYGYHVACHQRSLTSGFPALDLLRSLGYDVEVIETGTCCGMAGTFGLKAGPLGYDLSVAVGDPLFDLFNNSGLDVILTESSICKMQLEDGTGLRVLHPLELICGF